MVTYMLKYLRGSKEVTYATKDLEAFKRIVQKLKEEVPGRTVYLFSITEHKV